MEATSDASVNDAAAPLSCEECGGCLESFAVTDVRHLSGDLQYEDPPPVGGPHNACWSRWGVHDEEVADERWVHNLEHGGVVFLHNCPDGCPDEIEQLEALTERIGFALLTPYSRLPARFAAVAWGHRIVSDCLDITALEAFFREHQGDSPEYVRSDPPANCGE
jgi:hypothetical protein